jgi:hypothetical protein
MSEKKLSVCRKRKQDEISKKELSSYVVKTSLNALKVDKNIKKTIKELSLRISGIVYEVSKLWNLHFLKMFSKENVSDLSWDIYINLSFFVSSVILLTNCNIKQKSIINEDLQETYEQHYSPIVTRKRFSRDLIGNLFRAAGAQFLTNCQNHISTNFAKRTLAFWKMKMIEHQRKTQDKQDFYKVQQFLYNCFVNDVSIAEKDDEWDEYYDWIALETEMIICRSILDIWPKVTEKTIEKQWYHFLPWMAYILHYFSEIHQKCQENKKPVPKGVKLFTLVPDKGFNTNYIQLNNTSFTELVNICKLDKETKMTDVFNLKSIKGYKCIKGVKKRTFGNFITTDGVSASVLFYRQGNGENKERKTSSLTGKRCYKRQKIEEVNKKDQMDEKENKNQTDEKTSLKRIITLDPGRRDLFHCMENSDPYCTDEKKKKENETFRYMSTKEYRHLAGFNMRKHKMFKWMEESKLNEKVNKIPSACVSTVELFKKHLKYVEEIRDEMFTFYQQHKVMKLRWSTFMRTKKALDVACKRIVENDDSEIKNVELHYGDGSFSSTSAGHAPSCNKTLLNRLKTCYKPSGYSRNHVKIKMMDEFRTSIFCSKCHKRLENAKRKTDNSKIHSVLVCNDCKTFWNRDVNACRNMLSLALYADQHNGERIQAFKRF